MPNVKFWAEMARLEATLGATLNESSSKHSIYKNFYYISITGKTKPLVWMAHLLLLLISSYCTCKFTVYVRVRVRSECGAFNASAVAIVAQQKLIYRLSCTRLVDDAHVTFVHSPSGICSESRSPLCASNHSRAAILLILRAPVS